jgi:hypothetical protein
MVSPGSTGVEPMTLYIKYESLRPDAANTDMDKIAKIYLFNKWPISAAQG